jgi:hypothetical protein
VGEQFQDVSVANVTGLRLQSQAERVPPGRCDRELATRTVAQRLESAIFRSVQQFIQILG